MSAERDPDVTNSSLPAGTSDWRAPALVKSCLAAALATGSILAIPAVARAAPDEPILGTSAVEDGRDMLRVAAQAIGPQASRNAALSLSASFGGTYHALEQARDPAERIGQADRSMQLWFDHPRGRLSRMAELTYPGGIRFSNLQSFRPQGSWNVDRLRWRTGDDLLLGTAADALETRLQFERILPHFTLAQAEASGTVERTGPQAFRFRDASGRQVDVSLDPVTRLPVRVGQDIPGAGRLEYLYSDYARRHGLALPRRIRLMFADRLQEDLQLGQTRVAVPPARLFATPQGYVAPPAPGQPAARLLVEGLHVFEGMPGGYRSAVVDGGDHLMLLEAPLSPAYAAAQKGVLDRLFPDKPVRTVFVTHHHGDHTGGLPYWIERGATIIAPQGARIALERQLRTRGFTAPARIEEVTGQRAFGTAERRVDAYSFTSRHSASHLLIFIPFAKAVFQGDLFYVPERGQVPAPFAIVQDFHRQLERTGLSPEIILGVHGRPATGAELRASAKLGRRPGASRRAADGR